MSYNDRAKPPAYNGIKRIKGIADDGMTGKAKLVFQAKGETIPTINMSGPLLAPVTAQVVTSDAACWEAVFQADDEKRNDGEKYKAVKKP